MSEWVVFRRNENGSGWTRTDVPDFEIPVGAHHHVEAARRVAQTLGPGRYAVAAASLTFEYDLTSASCFHVEHVAGGCLAAPEDPDDIQIGPTRHR